MQQFKTISLLAFAALALAQPPIDPSGGINVGNGVGGQFLGGQCLTDSDCASTCCANPTGICSTLSSANSDGKTGCGFPSGEGLGTGTSGGPMVDPTGERNVGNGIGAQFIGGGCLTGSDCASTCCAGPVGICSGVDTQTQFGKTGCGFVTSMKHFRA